MRIYYCGYTDPDAIAKLAAVGAGKKVKRCGATAHYRCHCPETHADEMKFGKEVTADHPSKLCHEHAELLGVD
jgi:hypothetical protein